ncbi:MAG: SigB/SigF/SigG family RNA polymerase sigma factor [Bacilli bacterium]|nr:SigB/SigF/SigG family RNA polymerase sigma factor [Bacilli bacterium]
MARYKVEICGVNTANIKVLTNEEMVALFEKYQKGDLMAKEDLINGNLKLVLAILKKYSNRTDNMDDLFQVGCIGLIKAIDNFDLSFAVKFSTYACPMIIGEIKRFLRDNNSVRVSRSIKDTAYKILQKKEELIRLLGHEPPIGMLSKELELSEYDINHALDSLKDTVSMYEPIYNDGGDTIYLVDQLQDKKTVAGALENQFMLKEAIEHLKERERHIIKERYFMGRTQMELAEEIGISQAQISRLEKNGLETIKKMIL